MSVHSIKLLEAADKFEQVYREPFDIPIRLVATTERCGVVRLDGVRPQRLWACSQEVSYEIDIVAGVVAVCIEHLARAINHTAEDSLRECGLLEPEIRGVAL